ncbi:CoA ester lyase [Dactylosporangium sp. NPDC005572]|uniref:HpcH/HpaI aldolase/citrate lyase family protein n=1 Tax=Dactylosporangium sp. NPDC005572 TaxID=3156889 RepID=UPI0033A6B105
MIGSARSLLFVPGSRPDRFESAARAGADLVVIDIEDAVAPGARPAARASTRLWLEQSPAVVRVNGAETDDHQADLEALAGTANLVAVMLAKAETADQIGHVHHRLGVPVLPLVETPNALEGIRSLARHGAVPRLVLGTLDLAAALGAQPTWDPLLAIRTHLVIASAAAGIASPVDGVTVELNDDETVRSDVRRAAEIGLHGKLCLHPRQVPLVHEALRPTADELAWAKGVLAADGAVARFAGQLVDPPVRARARAILARAGQREE